MEIIKSILDTDLYKFSTSFAYSKLFPRAYGEYELVNRDSVDFPEGFDELLREQIVSMENIVLQNDEEQYLRNNLTFLSPFYIDFLKGFRFNASEVSVTMKDKKLHVSVAGLLYRVTLWETPILAIISELYYKVMGLSPDLDYLDKALLEKSRMLCDHKINFSLFGMRRRFSRAVEKRVTRLLKENAGEYFYGTSNVYFAFKNGIRFIGTQPHEWVQFHGAIYGYKMANYMAMENWIDVYDGDLGTALVDTYTTDSFLKNFSKKHAHLFSGLRQDSGDPYRFVEKAILRYEQLKIDPRTKYIVFSDSLNVVKAIAIKNYCENRITPTFGIGTNLTNDVGNSIHSLNIVMKLFRCKMSQDDIWNECIKLSDVIGKNTGQKNEIQIAKTVLRIE